MTTHQPTAERRSELRNLYPDLPDDDLAEVERNLKAFLEAVLAIHERMSADAESYGRFSSLTALRENPTMSPKGRIRSSSFT